MDLPKTPEGWASRLTGLVYAVKDAHKLDRFPIDVKEVAREFSRSVFPDAAITKIDGADDCEGFEGMLLPIPSRNGEWGIIYNNSGRSGGRANFSIAHEFGHYLLHRHKYPEGKKCTTRDMMDWTSEEAQVEGEANSFAANFLMPLDDFRDRLRGRKADLHMFDLLTERYKVSLSAAILRWLGFTDERAMIVVGRDGFIDWAWSSTPLLRSGIFYRAKQETIELPAASLAARRDLSIDNKNGVTHPPGVWLGDEEVKEMAVITSEYRNMTISLLKYPKLARGGFYDEEEHAEDTVDRFERRFQR